MPGGRISIDRLDVGPDDLAAQLPVEARLTRIMPGPDRPDYVLAVAQQAITHRTSLEALRAKGIDPATADPQLIRVHDDGAVDLRIFGLVLAARIAGSQVHAGMTDFPVALAYVVDNTLMRDDAMDFAKALYVAVVMITDRDEGGDVRTPAG